MELRHLRCFIAVAKELHFARAAERLNIEQSPLSRTIKELESELGTQLFERTSRGTRLTWAGQVLTEDVRRIFIALDQARANVQAAASGYRGMLRIALSDGIVAQRLATLLAQCRLDEPEVEIRLFEVPFSQQVKGLRNDLYDAGFSRSDESGDGIHSQDVWHDPLIVALPARHPLLACKQLPLEEVLKYPLILCHPETCEGHYKQIERLLRAVETQPVIAEYASSHDVMFALIAAGYGLGLACEAQVRAYHNPDVVSRPIDGGPLMLTTYLLRPDNEPSAQLARFIGRAALAGEGMLTR
ncbi:MAG: LysR substrate-binding domain-containing protein [Pseudoalteromonas distincta]|tara:strand:+ start:17749 stop:18648 length:900 start_codon:yes stop_codon:yes gene_type:complete